MSWKTFMTAAAAVSVLIGLSGLGAPTQVGGLFGLTLDDVAAAHVRLLGAAYLGYATIAWFGKEVTDRTAMRAIALGSVVSWAISAIVTGIGILTGVAGLQV